MRVRRSHTDRVLVIQAGEPLFHAQGIVCVADSRATFVIETRTEIPGGGL